MAFILEKLPPQETKGFGDPNDLSLRKIEKNVLIPELMREIASKNQCKDVTKAFFDCAKDNGILIAPNCMKHRDNLVNCMEYWLNDKDFRKETTIQYLRDRAEYRRTGITKRPSKRLHSGTHS